MSKRLLNLLGRVSRKGHEKLTVMFVPHTERRIFNFQISNFTILFSVVLIIVIVLVAFFAIKNYSSVKQKKEIFEQENVEIVQRLNQFKETISPLKLSTVQLKKSIEDLLKKIGSLNANINVNMPAGGVSIPIPDHILTKSPNFQYDPMLTKLATITNISNRLGSEMANIKEYLKHFKNLTREIPSLWPVFGGGFTTSPFGPRFSPFTGKAELHTGYDITAMPGTPIKATADGKVLISGNNSGYGLMVELQHKYGFHSVYGHCMSLAVKEGDWVEKGQIIAYIGRTGAATGYHLHYEVRIGEQVIDPAPFMSFDQLY